MADDFAPSPAMSSLDVEPLKALAFEAAPTPLLLSAGGRILAANTAAQTEFGPGAKPGRLLPEFDAAPKALSEAARRCGDDGVAARALLPDGRSVLAAPLRGEVLLVALSDAPPDPHAQAADGLSAAAGMGRTLAHEVKNPLAGIRGAAQLLKSDASSDDGKALAQLVIDEVDRIRRLVDRVEALSETHRPPRGPVNLHRVLTRVRALAETAAGSAIRFRDRYDPSLPDAWGDEDRLVQVFLNLVNNAVDALSGAGHGGGVLTLATAFRHGSVARTGKDAVSPAPLEVTVEDDGPGVPPALQSRLFDPFVTGKATGEGLGLALAAKFVAEHDGALEFESRPGRTVFRVRLPAAPKPASSKPAPSKPAPSRLKSAPFGDRS